jgi:hypothetical protein
VERRRLTGKGSTCATLDRLVHPPAGPVAQVVTEIDISYSEETESDYETITILPEGPSINVEDSQTNFR